MRGAAVELLRLRLERPVGALGAEADDGRGDPFRQAAHVVAESSRGRPVAAPLEALDEAAKDPEAVLERQPRVALAPLLPGRQLHAPGVDPELRDPAREAVEPARRQDRVQEGEAERRLDGG